MRHGLVRQVSSDLRGIRPDHPERYRWAKELIADNYPVIDIGCGIGYGSWILGERLPVTGIDASHRAIAYARRYWSSPNVTYHVVSIESFRDYRQYGHAVMFEVIEHLQDPLPFLSELAYAVPELYCSVPNEDVVPFSPRANPEHCRHYTPDQFGELLTSAGWKIKQKAMQKSKTSVVEPGFDGRTLLLRCVS